MKNGWYLKGYDLFHYVNNAWHNEKCPVDICHNGAKFWRQNYKLHRTDGPAIECNGKEWYYHGKKIDCNSQKEFERIIKLRLLW